MQANRCIKLWEPCPCGHGSRPCTCVQGPKKSTGTCRCGTTATSTNVDELRQDIDHGICRCTQRAYNDRSRVQRAATVGARLSPPRQNPENMLDLHNQHQSPCQCTATGESRWLTEKDHGNLPVRHDRDVDDQRWTATAETPQFAVTRTRIDPRIRESSLHTEMCEIATKSTGE